MNGTINDIIMALISLSLKEYMISKGDSKTKFINLSVPFSLREAPKNAESLDFRNDFATMMITLDLEENFKDAYK